MKDTHFEALDGLRGVAALAVFGYHMLEGAPADNPLWHAALAVDFFFCLSGFVVGHAYDARRASAAPPDRKLSLRGFALRRIIRLHPLVVLGLLWGLVTFLCNPFVGNTQSIVTVGLGPLAANILLGLLLIPAPAILWNLTHSLNAPAWSLTQEYLANAVYGILGHRVGRAVLALIAIAAAAVLLWIAIDRNTIILGSSWRTLAIAPIRVATSFTIGLLLHRLGLRKRIPHPFPILSMLLLALIATPVFPRWNGPLEWLIVTVAFPLLVIAGAGQFAVDGLWRGLCRLSGRLSYPLYMLHYPFARYFANWNGSRGPAAPWKWAMFAVAMLAGCVFSWVVLTWIDEPLRARFTDSMQRSERADRIPGVARG